MRAAGNGRAHFFGDCSTAIWMHEISGPAYCTNDNQVKQALGLALAKLMLKRYRIGDH